MSTTTNPYDDPSALVPLPSPLVSAPSTLFRTGPGEFYSEVSVFVNLDDFNAAWSISLSRLETAVIEALQFTAEAPTVQELKDSLWGFSAEELAQISRAIERLWECGLLLQTAQEEKRLGNEASVQSSRRISGYLRTQVDARTSQVLREKLARWAAERPFYGEKFADLSIEELSVDSLSQVPILTKDEARSNLPGILSPRLANYQVEWRGSSGTTDERFQAAHDAGSGNPWSGEARSINRHYRVYPSSVLTTPVCSGTECHAEMELPFEQRRNPRGDRGFLYFFFNSGMNPTAFPEAKLQAIYDELQEHKPTRLTANAAYLAGFVYWARKKNLAPPKLDVVWAGFEVPSRIHKRAIQDYFGCRVFETYGLTEAGGELAIQCEAGGNLHFVPWEYLFEVLDDDGQPVPAGEAGTIHLTTLKKEFTPLVRYNTGDRGIARGACECGCPLPAIGLVEGRQKDMIRSTTGQCIYPRQLDRHLSQVATGIGWYQLQQTGDEHYRLWVVPEGDFDAPEQGAVQDALISLLGPKAELAIDTTRSLSPSMSGKFRLSYRTDQVQ